MFYDILYSHYINIEKPLTPAVVFTEIFSEILPLSVDLCIKHESVVIIFV